VVSLTLGPIYSRGKWPRDPLYRRLGYLDTTWNRNSSCLGQKSKTDSSTVQHVVLSLYRLRMMHQILIARTVRGYNCVSIPKPTASERTIKIFSNRLNVRLLVHFLVPPSPVGENPRGANFLRPTVTNKDLAIESGIKYIWFALRFIRRHCRCLD
jgi:hypothetical protein